MGKQQGKAKEHQAPKKQRSNIVARLYRNKYKQLLIISILVVLFSIGVIVAHVVQTGDFADRGVSLKGGIVLTILTSEPIDVQQTLDHLRETLPAADANIQTTSERGVQKSVIIEASDVTSEELITALKPIIPALEDKQNYALDTTDPVLGNIAFTQTMKAVFIAFLFMAAVVFLYFGETTGTKLLATGLAILAGIFVLTSSSAILFYISLGIAVVLIYLYSRYSIPSLAVILAAVSDILFAMAMLDLFNIRLSLAGIAAFLMLIGYSVDTDILMSVRVLKRKEGTVYDRIMGAMRTGLTMSIATLSVVIVTLIFTQSEIIRQIMLVLLFGLIADILFTWIQNAGVLRWYMEKRHNQR